MSKRFNKITEMTYEPCKDGEYELIGDQMILIKSKLYRDIKRNPLVTFKAYKNAVWKETERQDIKNLDNFSLRGFNSYHIDHKISTYYGFLNKFDPKDIGHISNLRMIPEKENLLKGYSNHVDNENKWIMVKYKKH